MKILLIAAVTLSVAISMAEGNMWYATTPTAPSPTSSATAGSVWTADGRLWTAGLSGAGPLEARGKTEELSNASSLDTSPFVGFLLILK